MLPDMLFARQRATPLPGCRHMRYAIAAVFSLLLMLPRHDASLHSADAERDATYERC